MASNHCSMIKLRSSDGEVFEVELKVAKVSKTIEDMLENLGIQDTPENAEDEIIPIPNVDKTILNKIIEWAEHHKDDVPEPVGVGDDEDENNKRTELLINDWDARFVDVEQSILFDIILAANYLDIHPLLRLGAATVANLLKGKTAEQIRSTFNIKNDFTKEEEEQIIKENEWCEEK